MNTTTKLKLRPGFWVQKRNCHHCQSILPPFLMLTVINFTSYSKILIFSHPVATGADGSLQWWEEVVTTEMGIYHAYSPGSFQSSDSRNGNLSCISYSPGSFPQLVTTWHQQLTPAAVEVSVPLSHLHPHPPHVGDEQSPEKCQTEVKQTRPLFVHLSFTMNRCVR